MSHTDHRRRGQLSRRGVLRGAGAMVALPWLQSLAPSAQASAVSLPPKRLSVFYLPNGMRMDHFLPTRSGVDYPVSPVLEPLGPLKPKVSVVSGLAHHNAQALGDPGGAHGRSCAAYLTGAHPKPTEGSDLRCGISMDQVVANQIGQDTAFASLQLGIEPSSLLGSCDIGFSCTYTNTISWRSETQALPVMVNPREVFERLFGDASAVDAASRSKLFDRRRSILDFVRADAQRLVQSVSTHDQRKVDEYLTAVRDVERRIQKLSEQDLGWVGQDLALPAGVPDDFETHTRLMIDLQVLALQTDLTRVSTFMLGRELSNRAYPEIGVPDSHHSLSHHGGDATKIEKLAKISRYHMEQFSYLLARLDATPDGEGSLLDSTVVMAGSSLGEPNAHDCMDLPALIAGCGVAGNYYHALPKNTPMTNLLLTLMQHVGVVDAAFGDSTGVIPQLINPVA
ncbi:MAG: DUF1552 domain-containing protein [Pseudomonadales bacterium]